MASRVPETIPAFNTYINRTADYLVAGTPTTNRERLGLTAQNGIDWESKRTFWRDTLYPKYSNPATSTSIVKDDVQTFMDDFSDFASPLLNIIAASPAGNNEDEAQFNLVLDKNRKDPTTPETAITEEVVASTKMLGGGEVEISCRTSHDSKRPSKAENADSVQVAFKIGGEPPVDENDGTSKEIFTTAKFIMKLGMANQGKKLYLILRWYNTKHPNIAGPLSDVITVSIS